MERRVVAEAVDQQNPTVATTAASASLAAAQSASADSGVGSTSGEFTISFVDNDDMEVEFVSVLTAAARHLFELRDQALGALGF